MGNRRPWNAVSLAYLASVHRKTSKGALFWPQSCSPHRTRRQARSRSLLFPHGRIPRGLATRTNCLAAICSALPAPRQRHVENSHGQKPRPAVHFPDGPKDQEYGLPPVRPPALSPTFVHFHLLHAPSPLTDNSNRFPPNTLCYYSATRPPPLPPCAVSD
ncbi:hypothetical protein CSHISOI_01979 [Colletotrichum shisoi]|uniref:Uncharacterized protein n=1 Tax=Colletotrichum shisoi TaxID=2078593 RepID=A0A5Q4C4M9_9PEZI|nr:hypothetical protein CSHISOI_01979 [Colletotrichum shisoi]